MRKQFSLLAALCFGAIFSAHAQSSSTAKKEQAVEVGGAPMYPSRNIIENAVNSADHTTLVAAVKAAGLVDALGGEGPFTVFAPTNKAFGMLPEGTVETLLSPENKAMLTRILTYHVVAGKFSAKQIEEMAKKNGGKASFTTLSGGKISLIQKAGAWMIMDENGNTAMITIADVFQKNGVIHVIDHVILPAN